jgi:hypothetical protein
MALCLLCKNQIIKAMDPVLTRPASYLRVRDNELIDKKLFFWGYCKKCLLIQNINKNDELFTARSFDWIKYSEPEGHFEGILNDLKEIQSKNVKFDYIIGVSYKDDTFVEAVSEKFGIKCSKNEIIGVTNSWKKYEQIGQIEQINKLYQNIRDIALKYNNVLLILRRVIEHCNAPVDLLNMISKLGKRITILIETNNYEEEVSNCNYSFIWNERNYYPFSNHLGKIIQMGNFYPLFMRSNKTHNGFSNYILANNNNNRDIDIKYEARFNNHDIIKYIKNWEILKNKLVSDNKVIGIIGASHKGISYSQIFKKEINKYYIFDGASNKIDKMHPDHDNKIISQKEMMNFNVERYVVTIDTKWYNTIIKTVRDVNLEIEIVDFEGRPI